MKKFHCFIFLTCVILKVLAVPPSVCRAEFRWDDCGKPPKPVMYYWKKGSRCEIGIWKGCVPNPNMFADEYECINTCVFVDKPSVRTESEEPETEPTTTVDNSTDVTGATGESSNATEATGESSNATEATNETEATGETTATNAGGNGTEGNSTASGGETTTANGTT
ncbi:autotransporter adhesin BpaC-like [Cydia fagiglandana]|uniref:autotransporter adhesin BpaC-like n=1 Tax=Cydia fagiglandana TaxID=1458189 RepID=UPI002FEE094B